MKEGQKEFFDIMDSFRKLNISSMLPAISHGEYGILKMIQNCSKSSANSHDGIKISLLIREMQVPAPAISRALRSLEEKGLVVRAVDEADRRNTFVALTVGAMDLVQEIDGIMEEFADAVFGNLGDDTLQKLNGYFRKLLETSKAEIEKRKYQGKKGERQ